MNLTRFVIQFLIPIFIVSCAALPAEAESGIPVETVAVPPVPPETSRVTQTSIGDEVEEAKIRELVENFGKKLQNVSLLAPDAGQQVQEQYAEFVSPALTETWMNDIPAAPGRMVSSPWPDRIEITALEKIDADQYVVTGSIVEVTSTEVASGEAANRIPVHIVVEKTQDRWLITEFAQEG